METNLSQLAEKDAQYLLHPASSITALLDSGPQMIESASGCMIKDADGRELLDGVAGLWCVNAGYGRPELANVMKEAAEQLAYYHTFSNATNPWQVALAEKLVELAPQGLGKVFFGSGGSDANDTIVKIAWHYFALQGKHSKVKVIAREQAYHGTSISTASLTGLGGFHREYPLPLDFVLRVGCPHFFTRGQEGETEEQFCDRLVAEVAELIEREGADNIAAFIAEPIMGAGGVIDPPAGYFRKLQKVLKANDILLIADEVVSGYGRTGQWFASPELEIEPDMMATAKGLTSGYFPMSAAFLTDEIWEVLRQGSATLGAFSHGYTYSGHPIGAAVALANINLIESEGLVEKAKENGAYLHQKLNEHLADHPNVGEISGKGLLAGIQLVTDKANKTVPNAADKWPAKVVAVAREAGVIVRPLPSIGRLAISPPLIIERDQIDQLVDAILKGINTLA